MNNCIEKTELIALQSAGKPIFIVDVRTPEEYESQHIPTAHNLPLDELQEWTKNIPSNFLIVTACGKGGGRSETAALQLRAQGYEAMFLCGGTFGWNESLKQILLG